MWGAVSEDNLNHDKWQVAMKNLGDQNIPYIIDESVAVGEIEVSPSSQVDL